MSYPKMVILSYWVFLIGTFCFGDLGKHRTWSAFVGSRFSTVYSLLSQGIPWST